MKTLLTILLLLILLTGCNKTVSQFHWEYANSICKDGKTNLSSLYEIKQSSFKL